MHPFIKTAFVLLVAAGCTKATTPSPDDKGKPGFSPDPAPTKGKVTLTSVTLADDCGGAAPVGAPAPAQAPANKKFAQPPAEAPASMAAPTPADIADTGKERYRCVQTSMQLEVDAASTADVKIKSVEIFDEKGTKLGSLASSKPRRWSASAGAYEDWNEKLIAGQIAQVTYVLEQATFVSRYEDRTYTVKVTASVGGVDQPLQTTVMVVAEPPALPT